LKVVLPLANLASNRFTLKQSAVKGTVHVTVREAIAVLPQASVEVNVLVLERAHPLLITIPSEELTETLPQLSVAVAEPRAALI
jgi:hypothetical protein